MCGTVSRMLKQKRKGTHTALTFSKMIAIETLWALTNNQQILPTVKIKMAVFWQILTDAL